MKIALIITVAICAVTATAEAQVRDGPAAGGGFRGPQNPVQVLLGNREELDLTDDQFARLEIVGAALDETNAPLMDSLETIRSGAAAGDRAVRARMRSTMQAMRANQDAAVESAMEILAENQRTRARELIEAARPRRPGGGALRP